MDSAPTIDDFLTAEAADFFGRVTAGLDAAGIAWERAPRLVRGLDYYRHTAFEFVTDRLGAQGTVLAGGRYDGLIEALGGPHTPAVGWAAGIERLAMMIGAPEPEKPLVAVIPLGERAEAEAHRIVAGLRREGVAAELAYRGNMKKRLSRANAAGAAYALIIGDNELECGEAQLKDLASGEQRSVSLDLIAEALSDMSVISSERIASIEARRHELQQAMAAPNVSPDEFVRLSKDYAAIEPVAAAAREVRRLRAELDVLNGMVADPTAEPELKEMAATEAEEIRHKLPTAERALALKLLPRDCSRRPRGDARSARRNRRRRGRAVRRRPAAHVPALCGIAEAGGSS